MTGHPSLMESDEKGRPLEPQRQDSEITKTECTAGYARDICDDGQDAPGTLISRNTPEFSPPGSKNLAALQEKSCSCSNDDTRSDTTTLNEMAPNHNSERDLERLETSKAPLVKVSRSEKRGLFARFVLISEVTEPTHYSNRTKWLITFVVAVAAAAAPIGSAILLPSLSQVAKDLHSTEAITNLSVALYMLSMAVFPLWWSAFSEQWGRRSIYVVSFTLFILFGVLSAVSNSIGMLVVMRLLSGGAAASVQAVGAGTIADLWESFERGEAMGYFYLGPLCGPLLGESCYNLRSSASTCLDQC